MVLPMLTLVWMSSIDGWDWYRERCKWSTH
jgi:hypothetical protein